MRWALIVSLLALALTAALGVSLGETPLNMSEIWDTGSPSRELFWQLRVPRVWLAGCVGAALAVAGAALQQLTRNPLADPFVLGVSGGSALGVALAWALGLAHLGWMGLSGITAFAWLGAFLSTGAVLLLSKASPRGLMGETPLLLGIVFNSFALAVVSFLKTAVAPEKMGDVLFWLAGRLSSESFPALASATAVVALGALGLLASAEQLDLLTFGEEDAHSLGLAAGPLAIRTLALCSLVVAAAVSLSGLVGFVGLLVPNAVRRFTRGRGLWTLLLSLSWGATFLIAADLFARRCFSWFDTELPVGVVTALIGGPVFWLLTARRQTGRSA